MSEYPSEKDDREAQELRQIGEHVAEFFAMPLCAIEVLLLEGKMAILGCGHWKVLRVRLREGENVRCRDCYDAAMLRAQAMVERDFG
jgi:hypothetical protein